MAAWASDVFTVSVSHKPNLIPASREGHIHMRLYLTTLFRSTVLRRQLKTILIYQLNYMDAVSFPLLSALEETAHSMRTL